MDVVNTRQRLPLSVKLIIFTVFGSAVMQLGNLANTSFQLGYPSLFSGIIDPRIYFLVAGLIVKLATGLILALLAYWRVMRFKLFSCLAIFVAYSVAFVTNVSAGRLDGLGGVVLGILFCLFIARSKKIRDYFAEQEYERLSQRVEPRF